MNVRGEKWEKVGNWTQGEKRGRVSGVLNASLPLSAQEDPHLHAALVHDRRVHRQDEPRRQPVGGKVGGHLAEPDERRVRLEGRQRGLHPMHAHHVRHRDVVRRQLRVSGSKAIPGGDSQRLQAVHSCQANVVLAKLGSAKRGD
eukprot:1180358-Prorocentrum_minimum.AAC.4